VYFRSGSGLVPDQYGSQIRTRILNLDPDQVKVKRGQNRTKLRNFTIEEVPVDVLSGKMTSFIEKEYEQKIGIKKKNRFLEF
jgi:hypothetical protein